MGPPTGHDVQGCVDDLAGLLGHPVLIEDVEHRPLWWSEQDQVDQTRIRTFLRRAVDPAARAMMRELRLATAEGTVRTPALPEIDMLPRWCRPLRVGRTLVGYLWVVDDADALPAPHDAALTACARKAEAALAETLGEADRRQRRRRELLDRLRTAPDEDGVAELVVLEALGPEATVVVPTSTGGAAGSSVTTCVPSPTRCPGWSPRRAPRSRCSGSAWPCSAP